MSAERVYDARHDFDPDHVLHVEVDEGHLDLITIDGSGAATVRLDRDGAKKLRLALQRYERSRQ